MPLPRNLWSIGECAIHHAREPIRQPVEARLAKACCQLNLGVDMKYLLSAAVLAFCLLPASRADEGDNPYRNAKVGDFAEYKGTVLALGKTIQMTRKMVVIAKNDKEATIQETVGGKDIPSQTQTVKIDLTKPFDQTASTSPPKNADVKTEIKVEKGQTTEKIKAAGKEYDCTWIKAKTTFKLGDLTTDSDMKIWISKEVPLSGMVKMEVKSQASTITMELSGFGHK